MKISLKLNVTFVILLVIIFVLGLAGIALQKTLNRNFQKYAGRILPSAIEAIKLKADMDQVLEYARLYEMTGDAQHRWKAWSAIKNVERDLTLYTMYSDGHVAPATLRQIKTGSELFVRYSSKFLDSKNSLDPASHEQFKNLMNIQALKVTHEIKHLIDEDIVQTKDTEAILREKTFWSKIFIYTIFWMSLTIAIVAIANTNIHVINPIKQLTRTASIISSGNINQEIPSHILEGNNEISQLAASFDTMVRYLLEISHSRDDLNIEMNEKIENDAASLQELKESIGRMPAEHPLAFAAFADDFLIPINAVLGYAELLNQDMLTPAKKEELISRIKDKTLYLSRLTHDLSTLSKIETGSLNIIKKPFSVADLLDEILNYAQKEREQKKLGTTLNISTPRDGDFDLLLSDRYRLKQVFCKLIDNSLEATTSGSITIGYELNLDNSRARFFVKDTGRGVEEKDIPHVFEAFKQTPASDRKDKAGLNLSICRGIMQVLGGEIWVESAALKGTSTYFEVDTREPEDSESLAQKSINWEGKTFLIADDEEINKVLITEILEKTNACLIFADDGRKAIEAFKSTKFDLVLMDLKMPEVDGYEATRMMKAIDPGVPIIANTAYAIHHERENCIEAGCDDYISKPFNINELLGIISKNIKP